MTERTRSPQLPAWPVFVLFAGFPLWWAAGLSAFAVVLSSVPMVVLLAQRKRVELPLAFLLWVGFLLWAGAAALELSIDARLVGFGVRMSSYLGATVVFVYVFNAREQLTDRRVLQTLVLFFAFVVLGGYLGMVFPNVSFSTPMERLLTAFVPRVAENEFVHALVHPTFAEVQRPYGSPQTFYRPSAPFPYTNTWGCNVALLVPLVIGAMTVVRRPGARLALAALLAAAALPAFATLNRGMFLAVAIGLCYASLRLALRGRLLALMAIGTGSAVIGGAAVATGQVATLQSRMHYSHSIVGRKAIYREAFEGALQSPFFGHGAPEPSQTLTVSIGTQGQLWNVMFSYGFVALALFLGWFLLAALYGLRAVRPEQLWIHTALVVCLLTFGFYGYDGIQLAVAMVAAALATRAGRAPPSVDVPPAALSRRTAVEPRARLLNRASRSAATSDALDGE